MLSQEEQEKQEYRDQCNKGTLRHAEWLKRDGTEFYELPFEKQKMLLPIEHYVHEKREIFRDEVAHLWDGFEIDDDFPVEFDFSKIQKFTWAEWREYFEEISTKYRNIFE